MIKMKKHKKIILIGVAASLILVTTLLLLLSKEENYTVEQQKNIYYESTNCDKDELYGIYEPKLEHLGDNKYKISINGEDASPNAKFRVEKAFQRPIGEDITNDKNDISLSASGSNTGDITKNNPHEYIIIPQEKNNLGGYQIGVKIKLVEGAACAGKLYSEDGFSAELIVEIQGSPIESGAEKKIANTNRGEGKICTNFINGTYNAEQFEGISESNFNKYNYAAVGSKGQTFYQELIDYCFSDSVIYNYTEEEISDLISDAIGIWKNSTIDTTTLDLNFEQIKAKADLSNTSTDYSLKCSYNVKKDDIKNASDYYNNKNYYYKKQTTTEKVTYNYNYTSGNTKTETKNICKRTCEEAVMVEYGPPVASKAGFCFEYKVKVTSYVKCNSNVTGSAPAKATYCTPSPYCNNGVPGYTSQAGPNEEFESCIEKCDGGKYTEKCSKKCYKEIYETDKITTELSFDTKINATQLANIGQNCNDSDGCYYWKDGYITWKKGTKDFGRWYYASNYCSYRSDCGPGGALATDMYYADAKGIRRADYGSSVCQDVCVWQGCSKNSYLNPAEASEDYAQNIKAYNKAVSDCKASASCSTKTAEFSISIKYDTDTDGDGKRTVNKVYYPFTTNEESIKHDAEYEEDEIPTEKLNAQGNNSVSDSSIILSYAGCYKDKEVENKYMTEWSFPGTYIHNKKGQISYKEKTSGSWYFEKDKFCTVLDAEDVNTKWWEWYQLGKSYTPAELQEELNGKTGTSNGYNIEAIAKDFGYFGWNFNIKCFYALSTSGIPQCIDGEEPCDDYDDYLIRSVDIDNLFPNSNNDGVIEEGERAVGYNWTDDAKILSIKNESYHVDPISLRERIETNANILYDDSNLEYKFTLTPATLNKIRKYNNTTAYGDFGGTTTEINGVMAYKSNLFRSGVGTNIIDHSNVNIKAEIGTNNTKTARAGG